jgi:guanosine-3',5'-bis(diphosphate) 3'-pyrophosphohydrolase
MTSRPLSDIGRLLRAAHFSADKHRDQRRKGVRNTPYINHPLEVADRLNRIAGVEDATILAAAILHDTIEDTETTEAELAREFGREVAALVAELTEDKEPHWTVRKRHEIDSAPGLSPAAKLIKLSDKTSNVADTAGNPPGDWTLDRRRDYLTFAALVADGCRGQNAALDAEFDRVLADARRRIG